MPRILISPWVNPKEFACKSSSQLSNIFRNQMVMYLIFKLIVISAKYEEK